MFNNDRLSHWLIGVLVGWGLAFMLLGLPIFHVWLGMTTSSIAWFAAAACALQLVFIPLLFAARATPEHPEGLRSKRRTTVIIWLTLTATLFSYCIVRRDDPAARIVFLGTPLVAGGIRLILLAARNKSARRS